MADIIKQLEEEFKRQDANGAENLGEPQWYVINTFKNKEREVEKALLQRIESFNLQDQILKVVVCDKEVDVYDKDGKLKNEKKLENQYAGYVFVKMIMSDNAWFIVRNTPNVSGFVGSSGKGTKPFPMKERDMEPVLRRASLTEAPSCSFEVGEYVRVISGTLTGTEGQIVEIDEKNNEVKVKTLIFGREINHEFNFNEIEKIKQN